MPVSGKLAALAVYLSLLEAERVKPVQVAVRRVLRRLKLEGKPVDRYVSGVVYGIYKSLGIVDKLVNYITNGEEIDEKTRAILRAAVYAAVLDKVGREGFRDALLRGLRRLVLEEIEDQELAQLLYDTITQLKSLVGEEIDLRKYGVDEVEAKYLVAKWIYDRLVAAWGRAEAERILQWFNSSLRPHWLRVNTLKTTLADAQKLAEADGVRFKVSSRVPNMIAVYGSLGSNLTKAIDEGLLVPQDESAAAAVYMLQPRKGEIIVDLCAAPGGKTSLIVELTEGKAEVHAFEVSPSRARAMRERLEKLGVIDSVQIHVEDARRAPDVLGEGIADAVLLDPPCSSTGVLDKSFDARWQSEESLKELVKLQEELLEAAWRLVKPGGRLLYVTCSLLPEENEEQIKRFLRRHEDTILEDLRGPYERSPRLPKARRSWPHKHETAGMFYALIVKRKPGVEEWVG